MRSITCALILCAMVAAGGPALGEETNAEPEQVDTELPMGPILLGSFGLVAVAVGAGFGWQADQEHDSFNEAATATVNGQDVTTYPNASDSLADDIETHAIAADVLMFGGVAVVGVSVLWYLLDPRYHRTAENDAASQTAAWRPAVGPNEVSLTVQF